MEISLEKYSFTR